MDIENANCKAKVSECEHIDLLTVERPIKIDHEITGLEKLIEELHRLFSKDHVNIHEVQKLMVGYKSDVKDWKKYAKFDRFRYTRNLVDCGNGLFNIMILCWGPAHASAIHDHADSHCFMKVLSGEMEEIRYAWPNDVQPEVLKKLRTSRKKCCSDRNNTDFKCQNDSCQNNGGKIEEHDSNGNYDVENMAEVGRTRLEAEDVCYINDALGLHRMENASNIDGAVSLHLYCPPFDSCRVFDSRTGQPTKVKVTFWSEYGKKVKHIIEGNSVADAQK